MSERYRVPNVCIFAAGKHRGKEYTTRDLDDMVKNYQKFSSGDSAKLRVPAVIGHDESQDWLASSSLPAAAWPTNLRRDGKYLYADFEDIPAPVARLLRGKAYRTVSSEVYDAPPEGIPGKGKMLRRVALLGGDIPQVKGLGDIPAVEEHSERFDPRNRVLLSLTHIKPCRTGTWQVFSEVIPVNREEMIAELAKHGMDTAVLTDDVPDSALAEMLRIFSDKDALTEPGDEPAPDQDVMDGMDGATDMEELPEPANEMEAQKFSAHAKKLMAKARKHFEKYCSGPDKAKMGEEEGQPVEDAPMEKMSELEKAVLKAVKRQQRSINKFAEQHAANLKKQTIDSFIQTRKEAGKILPYELDQTNPANLRDRLMRADAITPVRTFSERGKKVELTELDLQMKEIDNRKPFTFSERMKAGKAGTNHLEAADHETAELEAHYEMFSEQFSKQGTTKEAMIKAFKGEKSMRPQLTVDEFLNRGR